VHFYKLYTDLMLSIRGSKNYPPIRPPLLGGKCAVQPLKKFSGSFWTEYFQIAKYENDLNLTSREVPLLALRHRLRPRGLQKKICNQDQSDKGVEIQLGSRVSLHNPHYSV